MTWFLEEWPYLLIAFGGVCAVAGSYFAAQKQSKFEADMRTKASETLQKTHEALASTQEAIASITGGDSYVKLEGFLPTTRDQFYVWLESEGKHTVYDVQFRIEDGTAGADFLKREVAAGRFPDARTMLAMDKFKHILKLGNVSPSRIVKNVFDFKFPKDRADYGFNYDIQARNGSVRGYLEFVRNTKGLWYIKSHKAWKNGEVLTDVTNEIPDMAKPEDAPTAAEKK